MRIIGIMLVRNEDRFVETALRNVIEFCDEFLAVDHCSDDRTPAILDQIAADFPDRLRVIRTNDTRESHGLIQPYAGTDTWVFGVDGDEIYDPAGLLRLRERLTAGEFANWWVVFGNVLNVKSLDQLRSVASGHLAPPCRSMTKLYNFAAINAWGGDCIERLHGGEVDFRDGFDASLRCFLHESVSWEEADFRCLHMCFLRRSSKDSENAAPRRNIMDRHEWSFEKIRRRLAETFLGRKRVDWKDEKYARGPLVEKSVDAFFPIKCELP